MQKNIRWIFDNAILTNWLAFGHGVVGIILIALLGIGIAEHSGFLSALIRKMGASLKPKLLPPMLIFLGVMSSIATDAGYLILIPLAGMLYAGMNKNPLIGMAAAFAGVSAGFSANLVPATPIDAIIGSTAQMFADMQDVPFVDGAGNSLNPLTMHYFFIVVSTFLLVAMGSWVTVRYTEPKLSKVSYQLPESYSSDEFALTDVEKKGLRQTAISLFIGVILLALLCTSGPLSTFTNDEGKIVKPFLNNAVILISFLFALMGMTYGYSTGKFSRLQDAVDAMTKQMNSVGYIMVLTLFSHNFLALLSYSNLGTYITYLGANSLVALGLSNQPILLLIGLILITGLINLFVGSLTAKWMLLGPIFVPMLYQVNPAMTPDIVSAAYRVADSSTNIITPMMTYAGAILMFMRKYKPDMNLGDMIGMMIPYSITFILSWTGLLLIFFSFTIPLGF